MESKHLRKKTREVVYQAKKKCAKLFPFSHHLHFGVRIYGKKRGVLLRGTMLGAEKNYYYRILGRKRGQLNFGSHKAWCQEMVPNTQPQVISTKN